MNAQTFFWPIAEQIPSFRLIDARDNAHAADVSSHAAYPLAEAVVHVWAWDLDVPPTPSNWELLNEEETHRARRFVFPRDRYRYVRAHTVMRTILAGYLGVPPAEIIFSSGQYAKPQIKSGETLQDIRFNLSHSAGLAVLAVARGYELGIDVEMVRPIERDVAEGHFSPHELLTLQTLPPEEWLHGFYRCWTSKEALLKGEGLGLNLPLDAFDVEANPQRSPALLDFRAPASIAPGWLLIELNPAQNAICTLAMRAETGQLTAQSLQGKAVQCFVFNQ